MTRDRRRQLAKLARQMNRQGGRWVPVTSGLLDCLEIAIDSIEAEFLLKTRGRAVNQEELLALSGMPAEVFDAFFAGLLKKGLLLTDSSDSEPACFRLAPIFIGWFEFYMAGEDSPERIEFARRVRAYFDFFKRFNIPPMRGLQNFQARWTRPPQTTLPLELPQTPPARGRKIVLDTDLAIPASEVHPAASVSELIEKQGSAGSIALIQCFCREMSRRSGTPCQYHLPSEACIVIGPMVEHAVRYGIARRISKEEALAKVRETAELGALHTVFQQEHSGQLREVAICNCCRDCCVVLGSNARGLVPLRYKAFWRAIVADADSCSHCGECETRCPVSAIRTTDAGPVVDDRRCVGCGQCTVNCPTNTLELVPDERYVLLPLGKPESDEKREIR
jgi:ferredoxin